MKVIDALVKPAREALVEFVKQATEILENEDFENDHKIQDELRDKLSRAIGATDAIRYLRLTEKNFTKKNYEVKVFDLNNPD
jgi:hypothetical protein